MGLKQCTKCKLTKPVDQFNKGQRASDGLHPWCKACDRAHAKAWYHRNKERAKKTRSHYSKSERGREVSRKATLKARYKMTPEEYVALLTQQNGKCAACGTTEPGGVGGFHVDHDHGCCPGRITCGTCRRGLLCYNCNSTIGKIETFPGILQYLERWKCVKA